MRVSFLPNVNGENNNNKLNKIVLAAQQEMPPEKATNYVLSLLKNEENLKLIDEGKDIEIPVSTYIACSCKE